MSPRHEHVAGRPARLRGPTSRVTIVVAVRNEEAHVDRFFDSLEVLREVGAGVELILVEGASSDRTRAILEERVRALAARRPRWEIHILDNPTGAIPHALNAGIRAARGDVILRLDAHTIYPEDYIEKCLEALAQTGADNVGGVVRATPADDTATGLAITCARNDVFTTGPGSFRTQASSGRRPSVPFGCFPRETFQRWGLYDERLLRNQDLALNHRISRRGGLVYQRGDLRSLYIAPARFSALFRKHLSNGWWNVNAAIVEPGSISAKRAVPSLVFAVGGVLLFVAPLVGLAFAGLLLLADAFRALHVARGCDPKRVAWAFLLAQIGHAGGQIAGIAALPWLLWWHRGHHRSKGRTALLPREPSLAVPSGATQAPAASAAPAPRRDANGGDRGQ